MNKEEYENFYKILTTSPRIELHEADKDAKFFESCLPVEVLASRGVDTLRFGPMKPVGLVDKRTGIENYAVVQLRQDNSAKTLFNLVGFQTNLKWGAQKELVHSIPGLENANIVRYGVMHRNTFINSSVVLNPTFEAKERNGLFFAGQITGTEGYTESIAGGLLAGINMARSILARPASALSWSRPVLTAVPSGTARNSSGKRTSRTLRTRMSTATLAADGAPMPTSGVSGSICGAASSTVPCISPPVRR
jgi:methylenetetrahydrofolate--tRNA-(uracil-5-)-methyltransferase